MRLMLLAVCLLDSSVFSAQPVTRFSQSGGGNARLLDALRGTMEKQQSRRTIQGRERTVFVGWIRDQVHVMKAMKYWAAEIHSLLEFYLEQQTPEGFYYDYFYPIDHGVSSRLGLFDKRYWKILTRDKLQLHRLPVEADLEYLVVEGAYHHWQATGDVSFLSKWLPALEKGMRYAMSDPLRWSRKHRLVKRAYTIDTWDFQQLPSSRKEYARQGKDVQKGIFDIDASTPMGIMHGDNSGMYAACRQLAAMHRALRNEAEAEIWENEAQLLRLRTNRLCWNGRYYAHFAEDDPPPAYLHMDQRNTLSLSNAYDINRGLPTEGMSQSIIQAYLDLRKRTEQETFAEWFSLYPAVEPHFADVLPGRYVNGGVITIVAGELAKAAFQHGYESYGADILRRILKLVDEHKGDLPCCYRPDGAVDGGIPHNWGQAAVASAMIEGLAGVVDRGALFQTVEISPRWIAAGIDNVDVTVAYGPSRKHVSYSYALNPAERTIRLKLNGDAQHYLVRVLLPDGVVEAAAKVQGRPFAAKTETVRSSRYLALEHFPGGEVSVEVRYALRR